MLRVSSCILLVLLISGCGNNNSLPPLPVDAVILAFGDSLTFGTGVHPTDSYPAVLQALTGRTVVNAGVPGEVTADGIKRLPALLSEHQPDLLILIHGGNDMLRKKNLATTADNLKTMISMAHAKGIAVIMLAVPNPTLILSPAGFYVEVANEMNVPIEIDAISDILQYPTNKSDAVHPNANGYQKMARSIHDLLTSSGAI